ncbi:hypothetical protein J6590_082435 [Homalodisca vitripennis]|nr:hypothetical protein J6590_082435 [Homalodisca vitripennis]
MSFCCVAKGSFHQENEKLFPTSNNSQCTAISACALAWKTLRLEFSTAAIDKILITGDSIYNTLRSENRMGGNRYLGPDELPTDCLIHEQSVSVEENSFVHDALYPLTVGDMGDCILSLSKGLMAEDFENTVFLFTGQTVTVAFWRSHEKLYLFDPHPVNEEIIYDLANENNNLAWLFQCESYPTLASLLLSNAALDGAIRQFTITRMSFYQPQAQIAIEHIQSDSPTFDILPRICNTQPRENTYDDPKLKQSPRVRRGRLKRLTKTRLEQVREAKMRHVQRNPKIFRDAVRRYIEQHPEVQREAYRRYSQYHPEAHRTAVLRYRQKHPEVHRDAVRRYNQQHPEIHRHAVQRYSEHHPHVNREAVRRYEERNVGACLNTVQYFRLRNPRLSDLRHLAISLAVL